MKQEENISVPGNISNLPEDITENNTNDAPSSGGNGEGGVGGCNYGFGGLAAMLAMALIFRRR